MTWWDALLLGAIQGLTEFLPVSSSGHLVLAHHLLGYEEPDVFFDIVCHVGTLLAVLAYYFKNLRSLGAQALERPQGSWLTLSTWTNNPGRLFLACVVLASVPTGIIGVLFKDTFEQLFSSPRLVGVALLITSLAVLSTKWTIPKATGSLSLGKSFWIGLVQGIAITPGISRSGSTIAMGAALGVSKQDAARFSFLLSVPAILGALVLKSRDVVWSQIDWAALSVGFVSSALVGLACLVLLLWLVEKGKMYWFSAYTLPVALFALSLS